MNIKDKETIDKLKKKYGKSWRRFYRVRKNYPFGRNSKPEVIIERKIKTNRFKS